MITKRQRPSIALLNLHKSGANYGAVLNAAALEHIVGSLGYNGKTLKIVPHWVSQQNSTKQRLLRLSKKSAKKLITRRVINDIDVFDKFRREFIHETEISYTSMADFYKRRPEFDVFVVGSDQVWRPKYTQDLALAYFLDFASPTQRRVAYAASFGEDHWEEHQNRALTQKAKENLEKFDAVSVREDSGMAICRDVFDVPATHVLDPTLLVERSFFDAMTERCEKRPEARQLAFYKLDESRDFHAVLDSISKEMQLVPENIFAQEIPFGNRTLFSYNEVPTWVSRIRESEFVVTDSYHCVCFAIIFKKNFVYYPNSRGFARVESLFKMLGIANRVITSSAEVTKNGHWKIPIDYDSVYKVLEEQRAKSAAFLSDALSLAVTA